MTDDPHATSQVIFAGEPVESASGAIIMLHGRGASARDILSLAPEIGAEGLAILAPQASGNTWYPHSFLMPVERNEPFLSSALASVARAIAQLDEGGLPARRCILIGFSQGACLASEYVARNPQRFGGLIVYSGGLIGPPGTPRDYAGSLDGTPVFIGCSDVDAHVPVERVRETAATLERMGAAVTERIYPGMGHTINRDELSAGKQIVDLLVELNSEDAET